VRDTDRPLALFDLDDTLCDYAAARRERLRIAFTTAFGYPSERIERMIVESIALNPHGTEHFASLLAAHGVDAPGAVEAAIDWYRTNRFHGLDFFDETHEVVHELRATGHRIGVVTNGPADVQRAKIDLLRVDEIADFVLISGEFGVEKPHPAIFHAALAAGNRSPQDAVFVGDSLEFDIAGARASGICSIWMNRTHRRRSAVDPEPDHEVRTLRDVRELLSRWPLR
jgi:HAD superfamily hydrolase (TIGR01549 family)